MKKNNALGIILFSAVIPYVVTTIALLLLKGDLSVAMYQADEDRHVNALRLVQIYFYVGCVVSGVGFIVGILLIMRGKLLISSLVALGLTLVNVLVGMIYFWLMYTYIGGRL